MPPKRKAKAHPPTATTTTKGKGKTRAIPAPRVTRSTSQKLIPVITIPPPTGSGSNVIDLTRTPASTELHWPTVPNDILLLIIEACCDFRSTLCSWACVNKLCNSVATPLLYRELALEYPDTPPGVLAECLGSCIRGNAAHVKSFEVRCWPKEYEWEEYGESEAASLLDGFVGVAVRAMPALTEFSWYGCAPPSPKVMQNIRKHQITRLRVFMESDYEGPFPELSGFTGLRSLTLGGVSVTFYLDTIGTFLSESATLREVEIDFTDAVYDMIWASTADIEIADLFPELSTQVRKPLDSFVIKNLPLTSSETAIAGMWSTESAFDFSHLRSLTLCKPDHDLLHTLSNLRIGIRELRLHDNFWVPLEPILSSGQLHILHLSITRDSKINYPVLIPALATGGANLRELFLESSLTGMVCSTQTGQQAETLKPQDAEALFSSCPNLVHLALDAKIENIKAFSASLAKHCPKLRSVRIQEPPQPARRKPSGPNVSASSRVTYPGTSVGGQWVNNFYTPPVPRSPNTKRILSANRETSGEDDAVNRAAAIATAFLQEAEQRVTEAGDGPLEVLLKTIVFNQFVAKIEKASELDFISNSSNPVAGSSQSVDSSNAPGSEQPSSSRTHCRAAKRTKLAHQNHPSRASVIDLTEYDAEAASSHLFLGSTHVLCQTTEQVHFIRFAEHWGEPDASQAFRRSGLPVGNLDRRNRDPVMSRLFTAECYTAMRRVRNRNGNVDAEDELPWIGDEEWLEEFERGWI